MIAKQPDFLHWIPNNLRDGDGRNSALMSAGGWMQDRGYSDEFIREQIEIKNSEFAQPLDSREVASIIKQVLKYKKGLDWQTRAVIELLSEGKIPCAYFDKDQGKTVISEFVDIMEIAKNTD